jgi:hypothetical protein
VKQLTVKDMLVAYYKCPQIDKVLQLFTHYNEIAFTISGRKDVASQGKITNSYR